MRLIRFRRSSCRNSILIALALVSIPAAARAVRVDVTARGPVLNGKTWGKSGAYEKIVGRVYFAVDPKNPHNQQIVDLGSA